MFLFIFYCYLYIIFNYFCAWGRTQYYESRPYIIIFYYIIFDIVFNIFILFYIYFINVCIYS